MKEKHLSARIMAVLMISVMLLSSGGLVSYASTADGAASEAVSDIPAADAAAETPAADPVTETPAADAVTETPAADTVTETPVTDVQDADTVKEDSGTDNDGEKTEEAEPAAPVIPAVITPFTMTENKSGKVVLKWGAVPTAAYYNVYLDGKPRRVNGGNNCTCTITGLNWTHNFSVAAVSEDGTILTRSKTIRAVTFREAFRSRIKTRTIWKPRNLGINLRKMMKESRKGYSVVQGGCTDGTYAYYLMVSSSNQKGRVLKVRLRDRKVIKRSGVLNVHHGNGMTYDSRRKQLVVVGREKRKQELTVIDANKLTVKKRANVKYSYFKGAGKGSLTAAHQQQGLAAIAYSWRYDVYLALERRYHNILIFDPNTFEAKGMIYTTITANYPGTYQAMDADDRYIYLLQSYYDKKHPYNQILVLDWNSEKLLDTLNKKTKFVKYAWYCNNNGKGTPDAVIRLNTKHEAENIYHTTDSKGRERFYLSEYYNDPVYKKRKVKYYRRQNYVYDLGYI